MLDTPSDKKTMFYNRRVGLFIVPHWIVVSPKGVWEIGLEDETISFMISPIRLLEDPLSIFIFDQI